MKKAILLLVSIGVLSACGGDPQRAEYYKCHYHCPGFKTGLLDHMFGVKTGHNYLSKPIKPGHVRKMIEKWGGQ